MWAFLLTLVTAAAATAHTYARIDQKSMAPMSLEQAMQKVDNVPEHIQGLLAQKTQKASFLSVRAHQKEQEEASLHAQTKKALEEPNALDRAKDTLNAMMLGTEEELDTALTECKSFDIETSFNLNENQMLRSDVAESVADARAEIGDSTLVINQAKINLEAVREATKDAAIQCAASKAAAQEQIDLLEADLEIGIQILGMTDCAGSPDGADAAVLLQCGRGRSATYHFKGSEQLSKKFKTPAAHIALQRAARMALGKPPMKRSYVKVNGRRVASKMAVKMKQTPDSRMDPPSAEDVEDLENMEVAALPPPPEYGSDVDVGKCSVGGSPACPMIRDSLSSLVAEIRWAKDSAEAEHAAGVEECERLANDYRQDDEKFSLALDGAGATFARATGKVNLGEEKLRMKVAEANELTAELTKHREDCQAKIKEGAETLCGIRTIRQDLYAMAGEWPAMQDCEVENWRDEACSATCGGGQKTLKRDVVVPSDGGAQCPPLTEMEDCGLHPCPIDCVPGDWSGWSACSKDCGSGVIVKSRPKAVEEQHGGLSCGELTLSEPCNVESCDRPCELEDWGEWSGCSRACDGGEKVRQRGVQEGKEAGPTGHCWEPHDEMRMHTMPCNEGSCPGDLTCTDALDLVILVDGSGSVEWDEETEDIRGTPESAGGWLKEKNLVSTLLAQLTFGEDAAKAAVLLYSWEVDTISEMTFDKAAIEAAVADMAWPGWNTDTSGAMAKAGQKLLAGRTHAPAVVLLITDGNPNDMSKANAAAETLKETARLVVVPIGGNVDLEAVDRWASFPASQNVITVPDFDSIEAKIGEMMSSICNRLECSEAMTGNGQDYLGCQTATRSGYTCQVWTSDHPHAHGYLPWNYPDGHLGDHNFCRNPDGDSTIWCVTASEDRWWEYCDVRDSNDIPV